MLFLYNKKEIDNIKMYIYLNKKLIIRLPNHINVFAFNLEKVVVMEGFYRYTNINIIIINRMLTLHIIMLTKDIIKNMKEVLINCKLYIE